MCRPIIWQVCALTEIVFTNTVLDLDMVLGIKDSVHMVLITVWDDTNLTVVWSVNTTDINFIICFLARQNIQLKRDKISLVSHSLASGSNWGSDEHASYDHSQLKWWCAFPSDGFNMRWCYFLTIIFWASLCCLKELVLKYIELPVSTDGTMNILFLLLKETWKYRTQENGSYTFYW